MFKIQKNELSNYFQSTIDLFICCASFEQRSFTIPSALNNTIIIDTLIGNYSENPELSQGNFEKIVERYKRSSLLSLSQSNPIKGIDSVTNAINLISKKSNRFIVVDITVFTRESLLIIFANIMRLIGPSDEVIFVYNSAAQYSSQLPSQEKWLSKGILDIRSVLGFPGEMYPSKQLHLVVLMGFETIRTAQVINAFEPSILSIGYGSEGNSISSEHYADNKEFANKIKEYYPKTKMFEFAANHIEQTREALKNICDTSYNNIIAPMNTKISTLGAGFFAIENPEVQLCYAQPALYNVHDYAIPTDEIYISEIFAGGIDNSSLK